jgi:hypothetical protein
VKIQGAVSLVCSPNCDKLDCCMRLKRNVLNIVGSESNSLLPPEPKHQNHIRGMTDV